jgi:hypothetical protein
MPDDMEHTIEMRLCKNEGCTCPPSYNSKYCCDLCMFFVAKDISDPCPCDHELCFLTTKSKEKAQSG